VVWFIRLRLGNLNNGLEKIVPWAFEFIMRPALNANQFSFPRETVHVDTSWLIISTCRFQNLSDQLQFVFHLFLVSYWLNVLPFPVSKGGRRSSRYMRNVATVEMHFLFSQGCRRNPPRLVWRNNCTIWSPLGQVLLFFETKKWKLKGGLCNQHLPYA
jgi:hypothetical protein